VLPFGNETSLFLSDSVNRKVRVVSEDGSVIFEAFRKDKNVGYVKFEQKVEATVIFRGDVIQMVFGGWQVEEGLGEFQRKELRKWIRGGRKIKRIFLTLGINSLRFVLKNWIEEFCLPLICHLS
jgi:hypothetical protein